MTDYNLDDFEVLEDWHMLIDEPSWCGRCGEEFEIGQKVVWVPAAMAVMSNQIEALHRDCAAAEQYQR